MKKLLKISSAFVLVIGLVVGSPPMAIADDCKARVVAADAKQTASKEYEAVFTIEHDGGGEATISFEYYIKYRWTDPSGNSHIRQELKITGAPLIESGEDFATKGMTKHMIDEILDVQAFNTTCHTADYLKNN